MTDHCGDACPFAGCKGCKFQPDWYAIDILDAIRRPRLEFPCERQAEREAARLLKGGAKAAVVYAIDPPTEKETNHE
jgi:hypothetical protein